MALDVDLLRQSFERAVARNPNLTARFYDVLFERYPQAKPLFWRNDRAAQERMLAGALTAVVEHLEDAPWLQETLRALGDKHRAYGVTPEMYGWVGASLVAVLAEAVGPEWTPRHAAEWGAAYETIVGLMS
jgi:hemoglobin-like flavoprotein